MELVSVDSLIQNWLIKEKYELAEFTISNLSGCPLGSFLESRCFLSVHKSLPGYYNCSIHIQATNLIYVKHCSQKVTFPFHVFKTTKPG